jgi:anaerobic selenocysteine-containing dehydrogenase
MAVDRRGFLKFVAGVSAGVMVTPIPWKLLDDASIWTQNWPWIPSNVDGASTYVSTVSKLCPSCVGMKVRLVGDRPVRILPDDNHPLSKGGISPLAVAEAQMLYSPARVKRPLKRAADGAYVAISWEEADAMLAEKLGAAKGGIACVSGDETGTINEVLSAIAVQAGSGNFYLMPTEAQPAAKAVAAMGGKGQLGYDIENSDYVLAIGANVLETWGTVIRNRAAYKAARPHGEEPAVQYVFAGPVQNSTAAGADQWVPIKAGTEGVFALGIAHLLIKAGARADAADFDAFRSLVEAYNPAKVAEITGTNPEQLKSVAGALMKARTPLVITGSDFGQGTGAATVMAGVAVNMLLGGMNRKGGLKLLPVAEPVVSSAMTRAEMMGKDFVSYMSRINAGKEKAPAAMVFYEANPAYALPQATKMSEVLAKVPFKATFTTFLDETAMLCDLVLPVPMGLERLDDVATPYGSGQALYCLARPVAPMPANVKPAGDYIIALAGKLGCSLGVSSWEEVLQAKAQAMGADWDSLMDGNVFMSDSTVSASLSFGADALAKSVAPKAKEGDFAVAPVFKLGIGTAKTAIPPYNNKLIRRWELQGNELYVAMNGATARKLGVLMHDKIVISNKSGNLTARVNIFEGIMNDTIAVLMGLGHTAFDQFSKGKGENVMQLLTVGFEAGTGLSVWNMAGVTISKA